MVKLLGWVQRNREQNKGNYLKYSLVFHKEALEREVLYYKQKALLLKRVFYKIYKQHIFKH